MKKKLDEKIIQKITSSHIPVPMCVVSSGGKIIGANEHMDQVFLYGDLENADFFQLTGVKVSELMEDLKTDKSDALADKSDALAKKSEEKVIERNGKKFSVIADDEMLEDESIIVFFNDVTNYEDLKDKYEAERILVARVNVDNYDEFTDKVSPETGASVSGTVERIIRDWAGYIGGTVNKLRDTLYSIYFHGSRLNELVENKFAILDEVKGIETGADFPLTLSIGIGVGGKDIVETNEFAAGALDLALSRGGDQAIIRDRDNLQYFGGRLQSVEKGSKGKSRIIGQALCKLIEQSNRVMIMGHRDADMDALGSALGIYRICLKCETEGFIVLDNVTKTMLPIYEQVRDAQVYNIITTEKALAEFNKDTLLVVVDTNRPSYLEAPELLEKAEKIVVIDHHRRGEDAIENPTLAYIETYASSASELVTEMLQYTVERKDLSKLEAEGLLGGITLDTNRFAVKTGVRTFEAAAWLRRAGADTTEVKRYFQQEEETFMVKARALASAKFYPGGLVTAICQGENLNAQVINAQVADEILNIKDIKASFVAGRNEKGETCVSARSLGDVNVQVILEKMGGGGHLNTAGAQIGGSPEEAIEMIMNILKEGEKK